MSKCNNCSASISFMAVLNTMNPLKVKCSNCKEPVRIDKVSGGIAALIISSIAVTILAMFYGSPNYWLKIVLPVVVAAEIGYFGLIKFGIVKIKAVE
ncbi:hypothetical protein H5162_11100 [Pseudoalteromonas sp. SR41-8]|jgi:uncharacterized protein (DUF983 family)|nr:hypothetical protein [Pseudoalteromonas sp. SR41-8]